MDIKLFSPSDTQQIAAFFAARIRPGDCIALSGDLGTGKSTFARAFLRALTGNPDMDVPSPSFALVQPYDTPLGPVFHYDLWRLDGPDSLQELAWDDACEAIMLVEWPERAEDLLPQEALHLVFTLGEGPEERFLRIEGWSDVRLEGIAS